VHGEPDVALTATGSLGGTPPATADDMQAAPAAAEVHLVHGEPDVALTATGSLGGTPTTR